MKKIGIPKIVSSTVLLTTIFLTSASHAGIPAGYMGKPYPPESAPKEIPGKINFHDYDMGGLNVGFYADDRAGQGTWGGSPAGRENDGSGSWPAFYMTWHSDRDYFFAAGSTVGVPYPSADTAAALHHWYIGASHGSNWTKWTVHVAKAGKYWISSIFGGQNANFSMTISFLNGAAMAKTPLVTLPGTNDYHKWIAYPNFASIQLDTGVQVLFFQNGGVHLNQDFLLFSSDSTNGVTGIQPANKSMNALSAFGLSSANNTLRFTLANAGKTTVSVFDRLGKKQAVLIDASLNIGLQVVPMNLPKLAAGIYLVELSQNNLREVIKIQR